jgi:hypothetical protein
MAYGKLNHGSFVFVPATMPAVRRNRGASGWANFAALGWMSKLG